MLLIHVPVGLKVQQYLLAKTVRVQQSLSNNNQDNNQDKFFSVSLSLTSDHPTNSKSCQLGASVSTRSPSVVSNNADYLLPRRSVLLFLSSKDHLTDHSLRHFFTDQTQHSDSVHTLIRLDLVDRRCSLTDHGHL